MNLRAINDLKQKQVDGKTRASLAAEQFAANHPGPGLSVSEDPATGPVGRLERVSNERLPGCFAFTLTDSLTISEGIKQLDANKGVFHQEKVS